MHSRVEKYWLSSQSLDLGQIRLNMAEFFNRINTRTVFGALSARVNIRLYFEHISRAKRQPTLASLSVQWQELFKTAMFISIHVLLTEL
jgi:hypothetical protein